MGCAWGSGSLTYDDLMDLVFHWEAWWGSGEDRSSEKKTAMVWSEVGCGRERKQEVRGGGMSDNMSKNG